MCKVLRVTRRCGHIDDLNVERTEREDRNTERGNAMAIEQSERACSLLNALAGPLR